MGQLDHEAHEDVNALLRQGLGSCLAGKYGGLAGIWDRPEQYGLEPLPDLTVTLNEYSMAGSSLAGAIGELESELAADPGGRVEPDLIGLGLFTITDHPGAGFMGVCIAVVDDRVHLVNWLASELAPRWEIMAARDAAESEAAALAAALRSLRDRLAGNGKEAI